MTPDDAEEAILSLQDSIRKKRRVIEGLLQRAAWEAQLSDRMAENVKELQADAPRPETRQGTA